MSEAVVEPAGAPTGGRPAAPVRRRWLGAVAVAGEVPRASRVSAAVCAIGGVYLLPMVWSVVVLLTRRGPAAAFERGYARAALLFQVEALALVAVLALPFVLDDGRTPGLLALPGLAVAAMAGTSLYGAVAALVGSGFRWPSLPPRTAP